MAAGFTNNSGGNFNVTGNTAPVPAMWQALFTVNGSAVNYGNVTIGGGGEILVSGSNSYTQDGGTTTVNGTLSANAINLGGHPGAGKHRHAHRQLPIYQHAGDPAVQLCGQPAQQHRRRNRG
jgi:hypothetical protein